MYTRPRHAAAIHALLEEFPVVGLIGARQVGKSTLARTIADAYASSHVFDLEDPADAAALAAPGSLRDTRGLVVLDEIHHAPNLFGILRFLADRPGRPARFLILGSASPVLLRQASESLAGRIAWYELEGLALDEVDDLTALHMRGGLPASLGARTDAASGRWREQYVRNLVERDLRDLGLPLAPPDARRLWTMLAHSHGTTLNASELGRSFGASDHAVRRHVDLLSHALLIRPLLPWHASISKRQVRAPKLYIADPGVLHTLLGLPDRRAVESHPIVGRSWEGFAIAQVCQRLEVEAERRYFWGTHAGAELDLLVEVDGRRLGFEIKWTEAPGPTKSMRIALADLELDHLYVVHRGTRTFPIDDDITALALARVWSDLPRRARA